MKTVCFAEIQGLYGPFTIAEKLLQKIWHRGDFDAEDLETLSGKKLERVRTGRWNMQEGPDFIGASLRVAGELVQGDVEMHFYAEDWKAHGHADNATFDNVVLHVLLFPPRNFVPAKTRSGRTPETLVLLPYLRDDLEDYANREALLALEKTENAGWTESLLPLSEHDRVRLLHEKAGERWAQKLRFAKQRIDAHGWDEACHQLALETLGLRRNRAPMSALAQKFSLKNFRRQTPAAHFEECRESWHLAGLRPANHPRLRLEQYDAVLAKNPDWPATLKSWTQNLRTPAGGGACATSVFRKSLQLPATAKILSENILAGAIGGTRLHTLAVDAFLPLAAAGGAASAEACELYWRHWPTGDVPENFSKSIRPLLPAENNRPPVMSNGLFQGLLQLSRERG